MGEPMEKTDAKQVILAQFESVPALLQAAKEMRDSGYTKFDCHSPFPIHGMTEAMGIRRSPLSIFVGLFALIGLLGAYYMQYWMSAVNYPIIISGKPFNSYPADTPVVFALAVLLAAFAAFFGMLALAKLPRFNHPLFSSERFDKFSDNGFFISIESDDPKFGLEETSAFLIGVGGKHLEVLNT
jgi:hypothetical protein